MKASAKGARTRLTAKHAGKIRSAFGKAIDGEQIAQAFAETHPAGGQVTPAMARDWVKVHATVNKKPLLDAIRRVYADGYVFGDVYSRQILAMMLKTKKAPEAPKVGVVNWDTWTPGNRGAAELLKPSGGLQNLLNRAGITIDEISNTKLNQIGTILSTALEQGLPPREVSILVDQIVDDPVKALSIAQTEMSRAVVQSELENYRDSGVEMVEWLVADPCDECAVNEEQSPIAIDESWENGDPPVHPNCMCDVAPYIVTGDESKAVAPDIAKFVPSKVEVERAKSRLKILPNPTDINPDLDPTKAVESAWEVVSVPTIDPNIWDNAELALVTFEDLVGTDTYLRRKKVKEHIESMGSATTPYRNFALVLERDGKQIIIDGHHRLMAMWLLGMTEAPVWLAKE